ncbi:MAG: hypothetical protein HY543_11140, partial [Deltaproteobacteria bacterium]|nr:hypothetical protein [Deltaproteobacteria bacterium]
MRFRNVVLLRRGLRRRRERIPCAVRALGLCLVLAPLFAHTAPWWLPPTPQSVPREASAVPAPPVPQRTGRADGKLVSTQCAASHVLKICYGFFCKTSYCPTGQYCLPPPFTTQAQCLTPAAEKSVGCASPTVVKKAVVIAGQTHTLLDPCPEPQQLCVAGQCVPPGAAVCQDSDVPAEGAGTTPMGNAYAKLLKWSQTADKTGLPLDPSVTQAGTVTVGLAGQPPLAAPMPDTCKSPTILV